MFTLKAFFGVQIHASFPANVTHSPSYICRHSVVRYRLPTEEVQIHKFRSIIVTRLITDLQREITLPSLHVCQYKNIQGYIYCCLL